MLNVRKEYKMLRDCMFEGFNEGQCIWKGERDGESGYV